MQSEHGELRFFSIYDDTRYSASGHWHLLNDYLGFVFDDLAFSFTESDCGTPTVMAHLRGLKCERLYRRTYQEGLGEYVDFALDAFGLTEQQLICMIYSPFPGRGERLDGYLEAEQPELFPRAGEIHALLAAPDTEDGGDLAARLETCSGLGLDRLRILYRSPAARPAGADEGKDLMGAILAGIRTRPSFRPGTHRTARWCTT